MASTGSKNEARTQHTGNSADPKLSSLSLDFLPTYEQHLNSNLNKFGPPDPQANHRDIELEGQRCQKRRRSKFYKLCGSLILLSLILITSIILIAEWRNGAFDKPPSDDQSPLSTRSEITITADPITATVIVTITEPTHPQFVTQTSSIPDPPTVTSTVSTTSTPLVNPWSPSLSAALERISSDLADHPPDVSKTADDTALLSVTTDPPASVAATSTDRTTSIARASGVFYACGVPGAACG